MNTGIWNYQEVMYSVYCVGMLPCCQCTLATVICQSTKRVLLPSPCHHCHTTVTVCFSPLPSVFLTTAVCFSQLPSVSHHWRLFLTTAVCFSPLPSTTRVYMHLTWYEVTIPQSCKKLPLIWLVRFWGFLPLLLWPGACWLLRHQAVLLRSWPLISEQVMISWFIATHTTEKHHSLLTALKVNTHTH